MAFMGRLHPLLIHFPIALVIVAVAAECAVIVTDDAHWRSLAVGNVRAGAAFALLAAIAGWRLALASGVEPTQLLEWHRWLGTIAAAVTLVAAFATAGIEPIGAGPDEYRAALNGEAERMAKIVEKAGLKPQ